ncbi:MAG: putative porin [Bacteroidota bacterium]
MNHGNTLKTLWLFLLSFLCFQLSFAIPVDSIQPLLGKKGVLQPSTKNDTWFLNAEPEKHYVIDSGIFGIQYYNVVQREGIEYSNTGNTGGAAYPLVYSTKRSTGFNLGYNQFDVYRYHKDSIKYYQVIRPYAELSMIVGLKNEQMFQGKFANQHKGIIYYGVDFSRISSLGLYTNSKTIDNCFNLYGIYNSKNKRWNVQTDLIFNSFKVQENGGVQENPFDSSFFQKKLVPVALLSGENKYRQVDFYLKGSYNIGKKYFERKNDSTRIETVMPAFKVSYQFNVESNKNRFRDLAPDSNYYKAFYLQDSVFNDLNYLKVGNSIILDYYARKLTSDSTYSDKNFITTAEAGFDYFLLEQNLLKSNTSNLYVAGNFRSNSASRSKIFYRGAVKYFLYGWNQNDFVADVVVGYDFGKFGMLSGNASYQLKEAPYIYERYVSHPVNWSYDLAKTKMFAVGGKYQNVKYGIIADLNYYVADHLPVYPGSSNPYIDTKPEIVFVAHVGNKNGFYGLHLDNDVWFTSAPVKGVVRETFPMLVTKHSIYYERRIFKKALWFAIGFDLRYNFKNNTPYYDPMLAAFYPTYLESKSFPVLDWFLNLKIKTVRVFLKVNNISSSFGPKGYYSLYRYPARDVSFQFGLKWRFFE